MTDLAISALSDGGAVQADDEFVAARAGGNVKIAGAQMLAKLFDQTLGADAASIDTGAGGIPIGFSHLLVEGSFRCSDAASIADVGLHFNNDTGNNYAYSGIYINNGGPTNESGTGLPKIKLATVPANTATANLFGPVTATVYDYLSTTKFKAVTATGGSPGVYFHETLSGYWASTAAITRLAAYDSSGGNLKAGSRLTIYGLP